MKKQKESPARTAAPSRADEPHIQTAIARAKFEWECTVDALPDLICLLDADGEIVRVNRVVERWRLGSLGESLGRDLHSLLHASCPMSSCALLAGLTGGWRKLSYGNPVEFELRDATLGRALHITLSRPRPSGKIPSSEPLAVARVADVTALHLAREALKTVNLELEARVLLRTEALADANRELQNEIARREGAEEALRSSRNELALLSRQLINAQEMERKRIARELHDSVGQQLGAIKYSLEALSAEGGKSLPRLQHAVDTLQLTMDELRGIAMDLRPPVLDDLGAVSAVRWFCREFARHYPTLALRERIDIDDAEVPERLSTTVFRSLQELLNNVAKHAGAHEVVVALSRQAEQLVLVVTDDGIGFEKSAVNTIPGAGRGISNLRERAEMTGGTLTLGAAPSGRGTQARLEWRLGPSEQNRSDAA
ncbi:MAG: PAS domain-containing protein [Gammaproteobacteria bacterium]|nr:PAS domain-containing protein [Gammaproteobacteria bacterium]MBV9696982.1 PAS domain-containing protein [Gammaproteobacteria bacterium]